MELRDAHVVVTGGSDGIGRATAIALAQRGARLTLCGRSRSKLEQVAVQTGGRPCLHACDLSDPSQHGALLEAAWKDHGPIDVLINNAGVQSLMDFTDPTQERAIDVEIAVNLTAPLRLTEAALDQLRQRPEAVVVQVTSGLALSPKASAPVYCATKSGLRAFTRALRWQLEGSSVRVLEVLPPLVDTPMTAGRGRSKLQPATVAAELVRALEGRTTELYVGRSRWLRWLSWLAPRVAGRITRSM